MYRVYLVFDRFGTQNSFGMIHCRFKWSRSNQLSGESQVDLEWRVPEDSTPGFYRIRHFGYYKPWLSNPRPYHGTTKTFQVYICHSWQIV